MDRPELPTLEGAAPSTDKPVVVVVRHPDLGNETTTFGDVEVIDMDLGGSFDVTAIKHDDLEAVTSWAASHRNEAAKLPKGHPARDLIEEQVSSVLEQLPQSPEEVEAALEEAHRQWAELSPSV
jgi:hypothetical protein